MFRVAVGRDSVPADPRGRQAHLATRGTPISSLAGCDNDTRTTLGDRLRRHVEMLAGEIGERNVRRRAALEAAAKYVCSALRDCGHAVEKQSYVVHDTECANLEVAIPSTARAGEIILAGAHYDTVEESPGADDNASGVAALIEVARLLRTVLPRRTIKLVAFVNEEAPFFFFGDMGSKVYAQAARLRGDDIRIMFSFEMLGCYSAKKRSQHYPPLLRWFYPDCGNFIAFVSDLRSRHALREAVAAFKAHSDFPAQCLASPSFVPGVAWSDHLSFWRAGYKAVMVTDTAFYRYPHYHLASDTPEKIDYAAMQRVTAGLADMILALANEV